MSLIHCYVISFEWWMSNGTINRCRTHVFQKLLYKNCRCKKVSRVIMTKWCHNCLHLLAINFSCVISVHRICISFMEYPRLLTIFDLSPYVRF